MEPANTPYDVTQMTSGQLKQMVAVVVKSLPTANTPAQYAQWLVDGKLEQLLKEFFRAARMEWRTTLGLEFVDHVHIPRKYHESSTVEYFEHRATEDFVDIRFYELGGEEEGNNLIEVVKKYLPITDQGYQGGVVPLYRATFEVGFEALLECVDRVRENTFWLSEITSLVKSHPVFNMNDIVSVLVRTKKGVDPLWARIHCYKDKGDSHRKHKIHFYQLADWRRRPVLRSDQFLLLRNRFEAAERG